MLKGFFGKVVKEEEGLSHVITKTGKRRTLTGIRKACVFPTSTSPTWHLRLFMGDYLKRMNLHPQGPEADRCPEGHMDQPRKPFTTARRSASLDKCTTMHFTVRPADSSDPIVRKQLPEESRP